MDFRPLAVAERERLRAALRRNADEGGTILLDRRDTSFVDAADAVPDEEVVSAIKSCPTHY